MPEKPSVPGVDKCNRCSSASGRPGHGPSPATHGEICCFYRLAHSGQFDAGCCNDCPGLSVQHESGQARDAPDTRQRPPRDGARDSATEPAGTGSQPRKRKKIEPRLRSGWTKLTIELRPERFKKKLWFGTYTAEEIDRAQDAVNFYMGCNQAYRYPDSPQIFASKPLKGIKFEDLEPSCEDCIQVGGELQLKHKYFALQVKEVIHSVIGKQKKPSPGLQKRNKRKGSPSRSPPKLELKLELSDPITHSQAGSTTSSLTQEHQLALGSSQETELSAMCPSFLPPPIERLPHDDEIFSEVLRWSTERDDVTTGYTLEEIFTVSGIGFGETIALDEDYPSGNLWSFQNEGLP